MKEAQIIKAQLDKLGSRAYLQDGDWISMPFNACLFHLWRKSKSNFEPEMSELGRISKDYYMYIGPANHDITVLSDKARLLYQGDKFIFKKRDAVKVNDRVIYYTASLRRVWEDEDENA